MFLHRQWIRTAITAAKKENANDNWKKFLVNINELVERYAPGVQGKSHGVKFEWVGPQYTVLADKAAGYARVKQNGTKIYLDVNGNPSDNGDLTHFKIKKKEEMP